MKHGYRRLALTVLYLGLAFIAGYGVVDEVGREYTDKGFKRALVTFAVARSLNGMISVAQGTEVAVQPAGIGINFTPGQILDPINDLVERFSWVILASSTSLGMQKVLMTIFASPGFTILLGGALVLLILLLWVPAGKVDWLRLLAFKFTVFLLFLRFSIPVMAFVGEGVFHFFLEEQYTTSTQSIERTAENIGMINASTEKPMQTLPDESFVDKAKRFYESATTRIDVQAQMERYKAAAADASEHAVNLIVIFVIQTILFPLLFLWLLLHGFRRIMSLDVLGKVVNCKDC